MPDPAIPAMTITEYQPETTNASKTMARIKFQKLCESGLTHWQFYYTDPATHQKYYYRLTQSTAQLVKNPNLYNDQRALVAKKILMIRHNLRQKLENA